VGKTSTVPHHREINEILAHKMQGLGSAKAVAGLQTKETIGSLYWPRLDSQTPLRGAAALERD
jgi:hypothetical protein